MKEENRKRARRLAKEFLSRGDPLGWFEAFYQKASGDPHLIPWADLAANPKLTEWIDQNRPQGAGKRALIVGCGLGDDAEAVAVCGFEVTAFDISATAVEWCRRRFPASPVTYQVADLFRSPAEWSRTFDFVFESYTLQVLPHPLRLRAIERIAGFLAPGGRLLVLTRGRDASGAPGEMPWPLTRDDLNGFVQLGFTETNFLDYLDEETPPVRRFRAEYRT